MYCFAFTAERNFALLLSADLGWTIAAVHEHLQILVLLPSKSSMDERLTTDSL
jgi:hypothetical protein